MPEIILLSERQLQQCVGIDLEALEAVEGAFKALAGGTVVMPPIMRLDIEEHHVRLTSRQPTSPASIVLRSR